MVGVGNNVSTCYSSSTRRVIIAFNKLRATISELYGVQLPETRLIKRGELDIPSIKKFCGGLLEKGTPHPWRSSISKLSSRSRLTVAGSLFLFRKVLVPPDPSVDLYVDSMSKPGPAADKDFLRFSRKEISRMFPYGWDRQYEDRCIRSYLPATCCVESRVQDGGCRIMGIEKDRWMDRLEFCEYVLSAVVPRKLPPSRVVCVATGGKKRIVSIPGVDMNLLRPFHVTLYDYMSRFPWLLRGEAKLNRLRAFRSVEHEVFVSGDYENATDNLNQDTQIYLLRQILRKCSHVPVGVMDMAESSLRMELTSGGSVIRQQRGQLMGNLVSFPLLCLVNYLALKYVIRRDVPVLINGDDILFRCRMDEYDRWAKQVGRVGLVLSRGKTMVDRRFMSLNSTWFEGRRSGVKSVPVVRSTAMGWGSRGEPSSLLGRLRSCMTTGFSASRREVVYTRFLKDNSGLIHATNRSVTRGLGAWFVPLRSLLSSNLWAREHFYLSMVSEAPLPPVIKDLSWDVRVPCWRLISCPMTQQVREWSKEYEALQVEALWLTPPTSSRDLAESYRESVKEGTFSFQPWLDHRKSMSSRWKRLSRQLRFLLYGPVSFKSWMKPSMKVYNEKVRIPEKKRWNWVPEEYASARNLLFLSSGFTVDGHEIDSYP